MSTKISQLPVATSPVAPDVVLPVVQAGQTRQAAIDQLGFSPAGVGAVTRTIQNKLRDTVSVKDFGAVGDGVADDTAAIQAAFDTLQSVYMPKGTYYVTDMLTMNNGQMLHGDGRTESIFTIKTDFNLSADGVVKIGTAEPGGEIYDIGFYFEQADQSVRANCTQYPPAIDAYNCPRFIIDRIRIEAGWKGLNAKGNAGGAYVGFIEFGTLDTGIEIDGSLDFFHGTHWHFWPFGMTGKSSLMSVYYDGTTTACNVGACDGLVVDSISSFSSQVRFNANATSVVPYNIGVMQLDNNGARLYAQNGNIIIGSLYSTTSPSTTQNSVLVEGGRVTISAVAILTNHPGFSLRAAVTGVLTVNGGFVNSNYASQTACLTDSGTLILNEVNFFNANQNYTQPNVLQTGSGVLKMSGCRWNARSPAGNGTAVFIDVDNPNNFIFGNDFADWGYVLAANPVLGAYGPNKTPSRSWTPVVSFETNGTFSPTYTVQFGTYQHTVGGIYFELRLFFSTNAFTGTAGEFQITGLPVQKKLIDSISFPVCGASKITMTAGYSNLFAKTGTNTSRLLIRQSGSGLANANISASNVLPSTTDIEFSISGFITTA